MIAINDSKFWTEESKEHGRLYCRKVGTNILKYPSVTTITSVGKKYSSGTSPSMAIGSMVHFHILKKYAKYNIKLPIDHVWNTPRSETIGRIRRCLNMWDDLNLNIKPICAESVIFWNEPMYAGRIDLLCKLDGDLTLIDIKTGQQYYDSHVVQASGYWNALRRKPQVAFVYLDSIIDRNPSQQAKLHYFTQSELEEGYNTFLDKYVEYK